MIQVNDDPLAWQEGMTVLDLLRAKNFKFPLLIISIDGTFVPKAAYAQTAVPDGADVKVVHLLSGG